MIMPNFDFFSKIDMRLVKKCRLVFIFLAISAPLVLVAIMANVKVLQSNNIRYYPASVAPAASLAIIFGGGMREAGEQSVFQADRVRRGVELYKEGKVKKLLMTGDDGGNHDDEVAAMKLAAIKLGASKDDIFIDPHGYNTYASCYRARAVYGITSAIVVSQSFHVPRILYLCRGMGVKAIGVDADLRNYGYSWWKSEAREVLARVKAWWQLEVTKPRPRSLAK